MKRRLLSLLLAMMVLCTGVLFTACVKEGAPDETESPSVSDVINGALEKTQNLDSIAAEMKMEMNMAMEGMTMSVPMTAKIKAKDIRGESPVISAVISMEMFGESIDIEMYQEGQWAYIAMDDMKYKASVEDMGAEYDYADDVTDMLQKIPEELLADAELVKAEDGSQTVTISFPEEKFAEIYNDFIEGVNSDTETDVEDMKMSDTVVKITVNNGYVTVYDIAFTMEMAVEEATSQIEVKATLTYGNPGEAVTVTPLEGYQDFEEMDDSIF